MRDIITIVLLIILPIVVAVLVRRKQSAKIVESLLREVENSESDLERLKLNQQGSRPQLARYRIIYWMLFALSAASLRFFVGRASSLDIAIVLSVGGIIGELYHRHRMRLAARRELRALEFATPLTMERIVMAVSAGLDILPALTEVCKQTNDGVSQLLKRVVDLSASGMKVETALHSVAESVSSNVIKHAFAHIALAHREGGELVRPLRELSDATQLAYQETVEEEIAKLPVKAVLPLVITFTGLIIGFLTIPLVQVSGLTAKIAQGASDAGEAP